MDELLSSVLIFTQRALLGVIKPYVRNISIDWTKSSYSIRIYLDQEPNDDDIEMARVITTEICADLSQITNFTEEVLYSNSPLNKVENLKRLVYQRYEE